MLTMSLHEALSVYLDAGSVLVFAVCLLLGLAWTSSRGRGKLPPGPPGYPILGVMPMLSKRPKERYKVRKNPQARTKTIITPIVN